MDWLILKLFSWALFRVCLFSENVRKPIISPVLGLFWRLRFFKNFGRFPKIIKPRASSSLHNYLADHPTDILSLNETWLQPTDSDNFISSLAPSGFSILNSSRLTGHGGGLAVIHKSFLKIKSFRARNFPSPVSFELMATKLTSGNKETIFLNIYRPPSSKISTFFDEFQNLLEFFVPLPSELIITGDFNIHTDSDLTTPIKFSCILDNFYLKQHIHFPTHDDGHTLDLLITRTSSDIITHLSHHESYQSDHKSFTFNLRRTDHFFATSLTDRGIFIPQSYYL